MGVEVIVVLGTPLCMRAACRRVYRPQAKPPGMNAALAFIALDPPPYPCAGKGTPFVLQRRLAKASALRAWSPGGAILLR